MSHKILYFYDADDWNSRFPLAKGAKNAGYDVTLGLIGNSSAYGVEGFTVRPLRKPAKIGFWGVFHFIRRMRAIVKEENPDIVHVVTLKFSVMCAVAALGIKDLQKIYTLAGLGHLFYNEDKKTKFIKFCLKPILTYLFKRPQTTVIFQNPDDLELFVTKNFIIQENVRLIRGSGVDLNKFHPRAIDLDYPPLVLMPTRLVRCKGISVFIEAANILKSRGIHAHFQIAGSAGANSPKAINVEEMNDMIRESPVKWVGKVSDMPTLLSRATLIVYPSYYGEGIPRVLLESCAMGKAIVTTDHTGCREAVKHGYNGLLVPVRNPHETADAIHDLLVHPNKRRRMEQHSLEFAHKAFDINIVVQETLTIYASLVT